MVNWEELPQEILGLIAGRLAIEDFVAFRGVCTSWRSAAPKETYSTKSKAPWLLISILDQVAEFFSPSRGRTYKVPVLDSCVAKTLSPLGWIIMSTWNHRYRIFNPLSSVSIELPVLEKLRHKSRLGDELVGLERYRWASHGIGMIALSSTPSLSRSYTVMISCDGSPGLAFHRSGEDAWTVVSPADHLPCSTVLQLVYYDGLFVALDLHNQIMTLDERERRMQLRLVLGYIFLGWPYLVECCGSLLVASKKGYRTLYDFRFTVFEVDLEEGTHKEVKSLGNASLFLNTNFSFSVEFNAEICLPGIKPNCIYFPDYFVKKICCYSMEDGKVETYSDASIVYFNRAVWFQPGDSRHGQLAMRVLGLEQVIYQVQLPGSLAEALTPPGWILESSLCIEHHIYNPLSRVNIKLPTLEKLRHRSRLPRMHKIALSSSPSLSRSYTVMISIHWDLGPPGRAFHRSGEDGWTVVSPAEHLPWSNVLQLICYNGLFVALDAHKHIMTLNASKSGMESRLVLGQRFEGCPYLVECSGSLLVAWRLWGEGDRTITKFRVSEVDLEKGIQEEVMSLGNASLFLNGNSSFSMEFNAQTFLPGIKPNCIYFQRMYCYSMEDGKLEILTPNLGQTAFIFLRSTPRLAEWIQPGF